MKNRRLGASLGLIAASLTLPAVATRSFAQVKVITSGGFSATLEELQPQFEKSTGVKLAVTRGASQGSSPNTIAAQLRRGVPADVVIMSREGLDDLIAEGRILAGTDEDLGQTPLGVSVRVGAPKPDISTVVAFKETMLHAKSVTFPGSTTGIYMVEKLFPQLGLAKEMATKTTDIGASAVAKGDAEIAIQPVSELLHVPGTQFVGTLPTEIQYISIFSAAMVKGATDSKGARQLLNFLVSEKAKASMKKTGMEPVSVDRVHTGAGRPRSRPEAR
jgi:molybdate transport system substrate-binding protein